MTIHDPLLAKQYGGQQAYESLVEADTFYKPDAVSNMRPIDQLRYARNALVGTAALALGVGLEIYGFALSDGTTNDGFGPVVLGSLPLVIAGYTYVGSTPSIVARYKQQVA